MADIFDELEEDLKEQKIYDLWKKWGNWIIGVALLIVIGSACVPAWKYYHHRVKADESTRYASALQLVAEGKMDEAQKIFADLTTAGRTGYAQLAALQSAALSTREGALKTYQDLSTREAANLSFAGLSKVLAGYAGAGSNQAASLETQFVPLAASGNPWQGLSLELQGVYALEKGDKNQAAKNFNVILNQQYISQQNTARALLMMAALGIAPELAQETPAKE